jgi:ferredoxin-nitrite reductase
MANPVEVWKAEKHGFDVWPEVEKHAVAGTAMGDIDDADLERMKWYGFFYRKRDAPGRYMSRIRITAGELSAEQAREIAHIAYEYGHGIVDVTTRANLQVQGFEISHLPKVADRLANVGLTAKQTGHDNIRNVFGHPFSGLMPDELIDTRQLCHDVTAIFVDSREYSDLPRKFNIAFNGTEHHSAHFWTQDLSFLATRDPEAHRLRLSQPEQIAFQVLLAGTQGQNPHLAWHLPVLVRPEQVLDVTRALLDLFRTKGSREKRNAARLRYLVEEIGVGGVLEWLEEKLPFPLQPCVQEPAPASSHDELIGWFRQSDPRLWTMGLSVPLGRMTWQQLEGLAVLSRKWGNGQLRTTHEQGIAVINIPAGFKDAAATAAAALRLTIHADPFDRNTVACTGSQFCNIAVTETKGHMFQLVEKLRKKALKLHGIRIHMSGCPSSCAQHFTADIGLKGVRVRRLLGTREGFDVYLGGGIAGQVHMGLPYQLGVDVDQLPTLIEHVVGEYYLRHKPGQTFSAYWRELLQSREAQKVGDDDYQVPVWLCEACEHEHRGEDPPVFCPSCAGLRRNFARLESDVEVG